jgi:hypothetical protein
VLKVDNRDAQYFEKGRIEDHSRDTNNPDWKFMYGRLTAEMMTQKPNSAVNATDLLYSHLQHLHTEKQPAPGGKAGVQQMSNGTVFVPYNATLQAAPGFYVSGKFWNYINRKDLFPGGWLHDIGLPMSGVVEAKTVKNGQVRLIELQAFERTVLTFDPLNPKDWQVERGNIGADMFLNAAPPSAPSVATQLRTTVRTFINDAATNPSKAEVDWASRLTPRARTAYVGNPVLGSDWINIMMGTQQQGNLPACPTGDDATCIVQAGKIDATTAQVLVYFRWPNDVIGRRVITLANLSPNTKAGDWRIDEVRGVDIEPDNRFYGSLQDGVSTFFYEWQQGNIDAARDFLSPELRKTAANGPQLSTLVGVPTMPRLVRVRLEKVISTSPERAIVHAILAVPGSEFQVRRFEATNINQPQGVSFQITRVMP